MSNTEYINVTSNLNRLLNNNLISNNEYIKACAILDAQFKKSHT